MRVSMFRTIAILLALSVPAVAQPTPEAPIPEPGNERLFGFEFEFAGNGNRIVSFEEMPWENYEKLMRVIVEHHGGDPATIRRVDFVKETSNLERYPSGERNLFRAEWVDARGRKWMIEPEFVSSSGYDGYELVTPPLDDPRDLKNLLDKIRDSGLVREGLKSGVHLNLDGRRLISPSGDARALANLILMHENMEPMLRRMFNPVRGGGHANRFARSLAVDHEDLLKEIDALRPEERTRERLEALFRAREGREAALHEVDPMDPNSLKKPWKYRAMNLAKVLNINELHNGNLGVVEFRMFDLNALDNPEVHRLEADLYRRMVLRAEEMAAAGETVRYRPRAAMPEGDNPSVYNTPDDPEEAKREARRMIESLGLSAAEFEPLLEARFKPRVLPTEGEYRGMLDRIPNARRTHNGEAFTFGFELEGRGDGLTNIMRPTNAEVDARWDTMSKAEKKAYFHEVVTSDRAVKTHFAPDPALWWLDPYWYVEATGNWEIHSKVFESVDEIIRGMREAKRMTETSGKGFHLHMRDNAPDWEYLRSNGSEFADFIERASNWVWLQRARRLGTMTSLKSWSNARMTTRDVENLSNLNNSSRATIRTQISNNEYIDVEIRGFTKYVNDIETLAKLFTEALKTNNFGPWKHTDNPMANNGRGDAPESLRLVDHVEKYLREVEGTEMSPEMRRIVEGMQKDFLAKAGGSARTLPTNLGAPLLPWENEASLPEDVRRAMKFEREVYLRRVVDMARDIMNGNRGLGLSLDFASEEALAERLGVDRETARRLIEARRARGGALTPEDAVRAAAADDAGRSARLEAFDINAASEEALRERLGVSEAEARRITEGARAHDAADAVSRAGISDERLLDMIDRTGEVDLASVELEADRLAERLRISEESARRILDYRRGHELNGEADVRAAGVDADRVDAVMEAATRTTDLVGASEEELRRLNLSDSEVERLVRARSAAPYRRYDDLSEAGISDETREALRTNSRINLERLNSLSAEALAERGGIALEDARLIVSHRAARDVSNAEVLADLLGEARGAEILGRATGGLDLSTASEAELRAAGLTETEARSLIDHRTARRVGHGESTWSSYNAERAATELLEAGLVSEAEAARIRVNSRDASLELADAEALRERFGLTEAEAREVLRLRDARDMSSREALVEAGLSEADAERVLSESEAIDPRAATRAEVLARAGLSDAAFDRLVALNGTDLKAASAEALADRTPLSLEEATRYVELRGARGPGHLVGLSDFTEAGISEEVASKIIDRAQPVDLMTVTEEGLRARGLSETEARKVIELRVKAEAVGGLNYKEIERQLRYKVKLWARETGLSEALRRSLLPRNNAANPVVDTPDNRAEGRFVEATPTSEGEGFSRARRGAPGEAAPSRISAETVNGIFETIKEATLARTLARMTDPALSAEERVAVERGARSLRRLGLEVVSSNDILAEFAGDKVRVSSGLLNEVDARVEAMPAEGRSFLRARILGLILSHEASHSAGIRAERVADMEAIRVLEASGLSRVGAGNMPVTSPEIRAAVEAFDRPLGSSHIDNFFNRLRNLLRYGTTRGRVENLERTARGEADPLTRYRRASDGTLKWRPLLRDGVLKEVGGTAHFALALFLKEVATVAATGDRARIEEFFDGLMSTDFYVQYGLFVAGARVGEVAYTRYLQRYVRPQFLNGMLKTNLVLAAGIALPLIVEGQFEGKAFAITIGSLGLSTAAVRAGVSSLKWVMNLRKARATGTLARVGMRAGRLANIAGWFYTAAELAVILYVAEKIEGRVNEAFDLAKARDELRSAANEWIDSMNDPNATEDTAREATQKYHDAWIAYRNYLYRPLEIDEERLANRLSGLARRAKVMADERKAALDRIGGYAALRRNVESRYGSLERYAESLVERDEKEIAETLATYSESYNINRKKHLDEVYDDNSRGAPFLEGVENVGWALRGGGVGADGDPLDGRTDAFANWSRRRAASAFTDAIGDASRNRLETYDDEAAIYSAMSENLRRRGLVRFAEIVDGTRDDVTRTLVLDRNLAHGNGVVDTSAVGITPGDSVGLGGHVEGVTGD